MKNIIFLLILITYLSPYYFGLMTYAQTSVNEKEFSSAIPKTDLCLETNYKHKSEAEIAGMSPTQLFDEEVKEQFYHMPSFDKYGFIFNKYSRKLETKMFPVLAENINTYFPKSASKCNGIKFFVAMVMASDYDRGLIRLRGIKEGQLAIGALEHAIERMKEAGFDKGEYRQRSDLEFASLNLTRLKNNNEADESIRDTLWVKYRINISNSELLDFSNFLILRDPTYPTWSGIRYFKDFSRLNEAGNPKQVYLLKKPARYYASYLEFSKEKRIESPK